MNTTDEITPPAGTGEPPRRLTRSSSDKVLTGLAGGLGRHLGVDPVVIRIAFVVLSFVGGTGILLYLAGWVLIPDDSGASEADRFVNPRNRKLALWVLALLGIGILLDGFDDHFGGFPFGLALVALGFAFLWSRRDGATGGGGSGGGGGGGGTTTPPPVPPTSDRSPSGTVSLAKGTEEVAQDAPPPSVASATAPIKVRKPRSVLVPVTLSVLAILAGALILLGTAPDTGIAIALLVTGVALVIGAWRGRARGLIPVAILLSLGLAAASFVDVPLRGGTGDRTYAPASLAEVRSPYRLGFGEMTVDLRAVDATRSPSQTIVASVAIGQLTVIVPPTVEVVIVGHAGLGALNIGGRHWEGTDVDQRVVLSGAEGGGRLVVRASVGIGEVEVNRALS